MLKQTTGAALAALILTGPAFAWTDIYIERAAMAEAGRQVCGIRNHGLAARYRERAVFYTSLSPEAVATQVERRKQAAIARLTNSSAIETFCGRIRAKDF